MQRRYGDAVGRRAGDAATIDMRGPVAVAAVERMGRAGARRGQAGREASPAARSRSSKR
jgi:hypothetical protein